MATGSASGPPLSVAIVTVSGAVAAGEAHDGAGTLLARLAGEAGASVVALEAVPDDRGQIEARLRAHVADGVAVILTVGGTGLTHDDVTPEATGAVIDREAPGFAEALRAESLRQTPMGMLTRGRAGIAGRNADRQPAGQPQGGG